MLLDRGIAQLAPPAELFARPASLAVARFLGFPNELPGEVRSGSFHSPLGVLPAPGIEPGPAVAVFRPEAVRESAEGTPVRVAGLRHRAHRTTAAARLGDAELEIPWSPGRAAPPGTEVRIEVDAAGVRVFSGRGPAAAPPGG